MAEEMENPYHTANPIHSADFPTFRVQSSKPSTGESTLATESVSDFSRTNSINHISSEYADDYDKMTQSELGLTSPDCPSAVQVGGSHYKKCGIQPWDYVINHRFDFWQGNILKYLTRWRDKGGLQDLEKCRHYIDKYIELVKNDDPSVRRS